MSRPRVGCNFNKLLDRNTYGLNTIGTASDVERLGLQLRPGIELTFYDDDELEDGSPGWMLADGVVVRLPDGTMAAEVDPATFRWELRS